MRRRDFFKYIGISGVSVATSEAAKVSLPITAIPEKVSRGFLQLCGQKYVEDFVVIDLKKVSVIRFTVGAIQKKRVILEGIEKPTQSTIRRAKKRSLPIKYYWQKNVLHIEYAGLCSKDLQ